MLHRLAVLMFAAAPALPILAYGIAKTQSDWDNEALWRSVCMGLLCALTAAGGEAGLLWLLPLGRLPALARDAVDSLLVTAVVEEGCKFAALVFIAERDVDARRRQDLVLLALGIALGFAATENFFYLAGEGPFHVVAFARALTAVPGHAADGLAMGALLAAARLKPNERWRVALALLVPVAMHAAYDFFALRALDAVLALDCRCLDRRLHPVDRDRDRALQPRPGGRARRRRRSRHRPVTAADGGNRDPAHDGPARPGGNRVVRLRAAGYEDRCRELRNHSRLLRNRSAARKAPCAPRRGRRAGPVIAAAGSVAPNAGARRYFDAILTVLMKRSAEPASQERSAGTRCEIWIARMVL